MSKKNKRKTASTAGKALALGTALSLGAFGFTAIGTGAAFADPTVNTATASLNTTKIIKLANGKTRVRVDLADNLRGKTVIIRTSRIVNGERRVVTLGRIKLTKTGKGYLTVSRQIRVDDRIIVRDGDTSIVNSKVSVIDDRTPAVPAPTPTPPPASGGGSSTPPAVAATFTVTKTSDVITFAGTATGDITFTLDGTVATFTRGGVTATTTADLATVTKITVASGQALSATAAQITGKTIDGAGNVNVTALNATPAANLSLITNTGTRTAAVSENVTFTGNLGTFTTTVAAGKTLTAASSVVAEKTVNGAGSVVLTGASAGDSNGFSGVTVTGGFSIAFTTGGVLNGGSNLGTAEVSIGSGLTLTATASQLTGKTITGLGNVAITALDATPAANLSLITNTGTRTAAVSENVTFTGNLGTFTTTVASAKTLTATASVVSGKTINGSGTVAVTALRSTLGADLSLLTANSVTANFAGTAPSAFIGVLGKSTVIGFLPTDTIAFTGSSSAEASADAVNAAGKWHFDAFTEALTYQIGSSKYVATLTGVANLTHASDLFTITGL
jgi:hypothetical protein